MNLKELSQNLGLSQTTVSRALNGYPEVSAKTRQRVEKAAAKFNYRPSNRAKGLATGKSYAIGHVIPLSTKHEMVNPIFGDFIAGAGETYAREGYEMTLSIVDDQDEAQIYRTLKSKNSVDGVVVHGPRMNDNRIALLQDLGLPFVVQPLPVQRQLVVDHALCLKRAVHVAPMRPISWQIRRGPALEQVPLILIDDLLHSL